MTTPPSSATRVIHQTFTSPATTNYYADLTDTVLNMVTKRGRRPASCDFCRIRKLRCSRVAPCHNCVARGARCHFDAGALRNHSERSAVASSEATYSEISTRLDRIEALVADRDTQTAQHQQQAFQSNPNFRPLHHLMQAVSELDSSVSSQRLQDGMLCDAIQLHVQSMSSRTTQYECATEVESTMAAGVQEKRISLPLYTEAIELTSKFTRDVCHYIPIFHKPSLPTLIDNVYLCQAQNKTLHAGSILILLAICTSVFLTDTTPPIPGVPQTTDVDLRTIAWLKASLDMIEYADRTAHASLECIQGMITIFWVLCSLEGVSMRARSLAAKCIAMAQSLSIHQMDLESSDSSAGSPRHLNHITAEIKRRVWWYLVASNWMHSQFSSLKGTVYTLFLDGLAIRRPCNISDGDIVYDRAPTSRPLEHPTDVSYLLQRIRLEEVCHDIWDSSGSIMRTNALDYSKVMAIDAKLHQFEKDLPWFFSLDRTENDDLSDVNEPADNSIPTQRFLLNLVLYRQLCQLHFPFFLSGLTDPTFKYSHHATLEAATAIIRLERELRSVNSTFIPVRQRMNVKIRSIFVVVLVLVVHACIERADKELPNRIELEEALCLLSDMARQAPFAAKLLKFSLEMISRSRPADLLLSRFGNVDAASTNPPRTTVRATCGDNTTENQVSNYQFGDITGNMIDEDWVRAMQQTGLEPDVWLSLLGMAGAPVLNV